MFIEGIGAAIALEQVTAQDLMLLGIIGALAIVATILIMRTRTRWDLVVLRIAFPLLKAFFVGFPLLRGHNRKENGVTKSRLK